MIEALFLGGLFEVADGRPVTFGSFFNTRSLPNAAVAALIIGAVVGLLSVLGFVLSLILGWVVQWLAIFVIPAVVDRHSRRSTRSARTWTCGGPTPPARDCSW